MNLSDLNPMAAIGGKLIDRFLPDPAAAAAAKCRAKIGMSAMRSRSGGIVIGNTFSR